MVTTTGGVAFATTNYDYTDESGSPLYRVVRLPGKHFRQERANPDGTFEAGPGCMKGVPRVLYRLPEVLAAVRAGTPVYVVEGEKDVHSLEVLGLTATTNSGGAAKWSAALADALSGADVVILPDNDDSGEKHCAAVLRSLRGRARSVRVVRLPELPDKGDASDWIEAGGTADALHALTSGTEPADLAAVAETAPAVSGGDRPVLAVLERLGLAEAAGTDGQWPDVRCPAHDDQSPSLSVSEADDGRVLLHCQAGCLTEEVVTALGLSMGELFPAPPEVIEERSSWLPMDLGPFLDGTVEAPTPSVLEREDGAFLLYSASVNGIYGDSGSGKSWLALFAAVQEMRAGRPVVWVDWEDPNPSTIIRRLRQFGATDATILERFAYVSPKAESTTGNVGPLVDEVAAGGASLVVLDSVGEAFGVDGVNENNDSEVGPWLRRVARPLAETGATVLTIDHSPKSSERPLEPSGSKRKKANTSGAMYRVDMIPGREFSESKPGAFRVTCAKDRHGTYARGEVVAEVEVGVAPFSLTVRGGAPGGGADVPQLHRKLHRACMECIEAVQAHPEGLTTRELRDEMAGRNDDKTKAIKLCAEHGAIRTELGPNRSTLHLLDKGKGALRLWVSLIETDAA